MNRLGSAGTLAILLLASAAYQLPAMFLPLVLYDEGIVLCGADRVLGGDLPYRDFWSLYGPGQFYTLALVFGVFGKTVLVERIYDLVVRCLISLLVYLILRRTVQPRLALTGWGVSVVWIGFFGSPGYPVYPFLLFYLVSVFFLSRHLAGEDRRSAAMAGAAIGIAIVFRHLLGALSAFLMLASMMVFHWARRRAGTSSSEPARGKKALHGGLSLSVVLCVIVPPLAVLAVLAIGGALPDMFEQLFVFPLTEFPEHRSLPYPSLRLLLPPAIESWSSLSSHSQLALEVLNFYLFPALCVLGISVNAIAMIREKRMSPTTCTASYLCVTGLAFLQQASVRSETLHLLPCGLTAILVFFISWHQCRGSIRSRPWIDVASTCVVIYLMYPVSLWCKGLSEARFDTVAPVSDSFRMAVDFVKERTQPDDRLFVGVYNHDKIVANYVTLYFMYGKGYGTKYHELHPGVITTASVQKEVVRELEANDVEYLLLTNGWWREPNRSQIDSGVDYLDDFIRSRFEPIMLSRDISVWTRSEGNSSREPQVSP